jgi:hypothetical protein
LLFAGKPEISLRVLVVRGAHVQGSLANRVGAANLLVSGSGVDGEHGV